MSNNMKSIDVKALGKVAVLMGGRSSEREVSLMSGQGVLAALLSQGVDAYAFDPAERDLGALKTDGVDRCFIALHGRFGEDGTVQGALELLGIPYTGSGVMASSIAMDKIMTKRIWRSENLPTPDWRMVASAAQTEAAFAELGAPMIVKPARDGSSMGLTKVTDASQCAQAYALAAQYDEEVLCEQFIAGEETTCAVLGEGASARALPVIRIEAPDGNYDYQNKYFTDVTQYHCPSGLPAEEETRIQQIVDCVPMWHLTSQATSSRLTCKKRAKCLSRCLGCGKPKCGGSTRIVCACSCWSMNPRRTGGRIPAPPWSTPWEKFLRPMWARWSVKACLAFPVLRTPLPRCCACTTHWSPCSRRWTPPLMP